MCIKLRAPRLFKAELPELVARLFERMSKAHTWSGQTSLCGAVCQSVCVIQHNHMFRRACVFAVRVQGRRCYALMLRSWARGAEVNKKASAA